MDLRVGDHRVNKSTGQKKKADAEVVERAERERLLNRQSDVRLRQAETMPKLSQAADRLWEERWSRLKDGQKMFRTILYIVQEYDDPQIHEIDRAWVSDLRQWLIKNPDGKRTREIATVNRYLAHLRTILLSARDDWEILEKVPKIRLERESNERTRVITREEQEKLTKVLRSSTVKKRPYDRDVADLVDFLCETGLRLSEALNLAPKNIKGQMIQLFPADTKSKAVRSVPLTDRAGEILQERGNNPFSKVDKFQANRAFNWGKTQVGIDDPEFVLHACRHTFASRLLESGASLYDVKELLGHANFSTTQRYSHLAIGHLQNAMNRLNGGT